MERPIVGDARDVTTKCNAVTLFRSRFENLLQRILETLREIKCSLVPEAVQETGLVGFVRCGNSMWLCKQNVFLRVIYVDTLRDGNHEV